MADLNLPNAATGLIGGLGMTRVTIYDQQAAPDGQHSGCPHLHAICAEAYYVLSGTGHVELHNMEQGLHQVELQPGTYFQFPPNTLHRLISQNKLVVLGIMSNAGLPENGDARIYFGLATDTDQAAYEAAVQLVSKGLAGALERRDLAVKGYMQLLELWENDRDAYFAELKRFIELHQQHVKSQRAKFTTYVAQGPRAWAERAESILAGNAPTQIDREIIQHPPSDAPRLGMCGTLQPVQTGHHSINPDY